MTAHGSLDSALDALAFGAYSYLLKPCDPAAFRHCVHRGLEKQRLTKELRLQNIELEKLNRELDAKVQEATKELRSLNHRILTEMASLREVDQLKSAFLDNVSHDLKSPLTTIIGYVSYFLEKIGPGLPSDEQACLQSVTRAAGHMEYLINQLLDATRLTSGRVQLRIESVSAPEVLQEAAEMARPQAQAKGLALDVRCDSGSPFTLRVDRGRLLQILNNLLGNACKFTPKGGTVTLKAWREGAEAHFCVSDTGPGIAPEHQAKIFDKFYQINPEASKPFKGLGLGLKIAQDLVQLHKGKIWVESEPGHGSRFHFVIPLPREGAVAPG